MGHVWNTVNRNDNELMWLSIRDDGARLYKEIGEPAKWWVQVDENCMLGFYCADWSNVCKRADEVIAMFENTGCKDER